MNINIRNERESEYFYVEAMTRYSFWNVYKPGCDEHVMVHKLRQSEVFIPELDFVAECDEKIVGSIICSKVKILDNDNNIIDDSNIAAIGPICVLPQWQNKGIGSMLIMHVKKVAKSLGYKGLVLYGNPSYYHRFGFVNAKEYAITTPDGSNFDAFMLLELDIHSLDNIKGKCYESEAFEVSKEELETFERNFIGKINNKPDAFIKLDYSRIKDEFKNVGIEFPLKEEECIGLSEEKMLEINPCGTYCGNCEDYGIVCDGCRNRSGKPIWYNLYSKKEPCIYYTCAQKNTYHDCSQCKQAPCSNFFEYPDPNMSDDFKQMWFNLRMENFNHINCVRQIDIKNTYAENEKQYNKIE